MNTQELFTVISKTKWETPLVTPEGSIMNGTQQNGLPITMIEHTGRTWLEITIYDPDMDDGREIEFEIQAVQSCIGGLGLEYLGKTRLLNGKCVIYGDFMVFTMVKYHGHVRMVLIKLYSPEAEEEEHYNV